MAVWVRIVLASFIFVNVVLSVTITPGSSDQPTTTSVKTTTIPPTTTTNTPISSTTLSPEEECGQHNGSCADCVGAAKCLYCYEDDKCKPYPYKSIIPSKSVCALSKARWVTCWLNFEAMLISVGVIGGIIVLTITCCCVYCCCCRGGNSNKYAKEDAKWERQKRDRKEKADERRMERKDRLDEIRRKYGLVKDDNAYERFDA